MAEVTLKGIRQLSRKLARMPGPVRDASRQTLEAGAIQIVEMMKSLVPVNTGRLKESIGWTWGKAPKGAFAFATAVDTEGFTLTIFAGDETAFYARWVEFGTAPHEQAGTHPGAQHPGTRAQPFFFPAYRANRKKIKSNVTRAVNKALKQVAHG